jgi:signal transduction histidine kinase
LSRCTRSLAGATDEEDLLQAYCQNLVDVGGYCFAWVGYAQEHKGLRRMAQAGEAAGDPTLTAATWSGTAERPRPSELPISTGAPIVLRHLGADSSCVQSPGTTAGPSCRSMISLPLKGPDGTFGSFSIYSADDNAFNETEVALLEELAQDVSLGIETMRARVAHEQQVLLLREEIEQEERKRIAATVHDGVGQSMQAVNLGLKRLRALADDDHQLARSLLDRIIQDVGGVIADLRGISRDLRPLFLERMELRQAMQYHCSELQEQTGIIVHFTYSQHSFLLDERVKRQSFLCFREALNNAVTHAKARRIDVILEAPTPDSLIIRVADDGVGFDPNQASKRPYGLGLAMIAERAASIGGKATIQSTPDGGTTVTISLCVSGTPPMGRRESDRRYPSSQVGAG